MKTLYQSQTGSFIHYNVNSNSILEDLIDGSVINWRIFESTAFTQLEPASDWNTLDLTTDHIDTGQYEIEWAVPGTATIGKYFLEVQVLEDGKETQNYIKEFEVIENRLPILSDNHYCLISDLEENGVDDTLSNYQLAKAILKAKAFIDQYCDRVFSPQYKTIRMDAVIDKELWFDNVICCLKDLKNYLFSYSISFTDFTPKVYARHLNAKQGELYTGEDDRYNSKIVLDSINQGESYIVEGVFGCTDPDGSSIGKVPEQVRLASISIALRYASSLLGDGGDGVIPAFTDRIVAEKTATQSYKLSDNSIEGSISNMISGDTELQRLLNPFRRPIHMGLT